MFDIPEATADTTCLMVTTTPLEAIRLLVYNRHTKPLKNALDSSSRKECEIGNCRIYVLTLKCFSRMSPQ